MDEQFNDLALGTGDIEDQVLSDDVIEELLASRPMEVESEIQANTAKSAAAEVLATSAPRESVVLNNYPFRAVVFLHVRWANPFPIRGTGFFVSETAIATAAHNLPSDLTDIQVYVKLDGTLGRPFIAGSPQRSPAFSGDSRSDYGVIHLAEHVGAVTGWFVIPPSPAKPAEGLTVRMSGYPSPGLRQLAGSGPLVGVDPHTLLYGIDTEGGDSGAPVWIDTASLPLLVGIHRAENGIAVPLTMQVSQQMRSWI